MTQGRKVVLTIAVAAVLAVLASALIAKLDGPDGAGWYMYSPDSSDAVGTLTHEGQPDSGHTLRDDGIWLSAIAIWLGVSWRLFRSHD